MNNLAGWFPHRSRVYCTLDQDLTGVQDKCSLPETFRRKRIGENVVNWTHMF